MTDQDGRHDAFFPKGTVAFFVAMILIYAGLWLAMYGLMAHRG